MKITAHGDSHIGRIRQANEDYFLHEKIRDEEHLFVVADGMGGHQAGDVASRLGTQSFASSYKRLRKQGKPIMEAMNQSLRKANTAILRKAQLDPRKKGMGTTFSGAVVDGDRLNVIHVGDSRIYLIRDGDVRRLTTDQTFVAKMVEDGRITEEEARDHPQKNILYMSLGARDHFTPEIIADIEVKEGDILVMCSDGLSTHVRDDVIRAYAEAYYPAEAVDGLIRRANESGGVDNITVQVVRLGVIGDLDNTVALYTPRKKRRFPYFWAGGALILAILGLVSWFGGDNSATASGAASLPAVARRPAPAAYTLRLEAVKLATEAGNLLRADPRHLVYFADGRVWLFGGDRYLMADLDDSGDLEEIAPAGGGRFIPNPFNQRLILRRKNSRRPAYSISREAGEQLLLEIGGDDSRDSIDQLSRRIVIAGLKPPVVPLFINRSMFLFSDSSYFFMVENPLPGEEPLRLRKCRLAGGELSGVFSLKVIPPRLLLLIYGDQSRQLRICEFAPGEEPSVREIPFVFFRRPLGLEYMSEGEIIAFFPDGAILMNERGESLGVASVPPGSASSLVRVVAPPTGAQRLGVTDDGGLVRVTIE